LPVEYLLAWTRLAHVVKNYGIHENNNYFNFAFMKKLSAKHNVPRGRSAGEARAGVAVSRPTRPPCVVKNYRFHENDNNAILVFMKTIVVANQKAGRKNQP
jgi:hypothetical protein